MMFKAVFRLGADKVYLIDQHDIIWCIEYDHFVDSPCIKRVYMLPSGIIEP